MANGDLPEPVREALNAYPEFEFNTYVPKGVNGYVVLGRHRILGRRVAMKIYYYDDTVPHDEPRLLSRVNSPYVLEIFDARAFSDEWAFFITPEASGGDLQTAMTERPFDLHRAIDICRGLLIGLSDLHCPPDPLIHRDLKPENILIDEDRPLIADFGSVRRLPDGESFVGASGHTILFRAPESFMKRECRVQSDLYQVGVIGYLLCGGELSYDLCSYLSRSQLREYEQLEDDFEKSCFVDERISFLCTRGKLLNWPSVPGFVPGTLIRVLKKATHLDLDRRFGSASDFLAALANLPSPFPNWVIMEGEWKLRNWKSRDYRLVLEEGRVRVWKTIAGKDNWRQDNVLSSPTAKEVLEKMQERYGLLL
jgi:serine/threonine protein kinase